MCGIEIHIHSYFQLSFSLSLSLSLDDDDNDDDDDDNDDDDNDNDDDDDDSSTLVAAVPTDNHCFFSSYVEDSIATHHNSSLNSTLVFSLKTFEGLKSINTYVQRYQYFKLHTRTKRLTNQIYKK